MEYREITFADVKNSPEIRTYIKKGNEMLGEMGYTEHQFAHADKTAKTCETILRKLGYTDRQVELAKIAAYMHDIGNCINRITHAQCGAQMSFHLLREMGMPPEEVAEVISAIGNHDEKEGAVVSAIGAALILADKSDVRRTRVRGRPPFSEFDIHDRVNYAVESSELVVDVANKTVSFVLQIDTSISSVMEYFEIFLKRMSMATMAARRLGLKFSLVVNDSKLL